MRKVKTLTMASLFVLLAGCGATAMEDELGLNGAKFAMENGSVVPDQGPDVHAEGLGIAALDPNALTTTASLNFCTSGGWHCATASVGNAASMNGPTTVTMGGIATVSNNAVAFYYTRMEHHIHSYDDKTYYTTVAYTWPGDWAKENPRGMTYTYTRASGYQIYTRLCFDVKDDGKGELCTGYARTFAVW